MLCNNADNRRCSYFELGLPVIYPYGPHVQPQDSVGKRQIDRRILGSFPVGTPYDNLYGKAPPERGTFFTLQVYERVGISLVEVYKRLGKSVI